MKKPLRENLGWYGTLAIVAAYALANFSLLDIHGLPYLLLNLTGSSAIVYEALPKKDYQSVFINAVWIAVAVTVLLKIVAQTAAQ